MDKELLKERIFNLFKNKKDQSLRDFVFNCLDNNGLIVHPKKTVSQEHKYVKSVNVGNIEPQGSEFVQGMQSIEQSSIDRYGFNRTFLDPSQPSYLHELQKRGITYEETDFNEVREIFSNALNKLRVENLECIFHVASVMYLNIIMYYENGNTLELKQKKGSIKKGYIALCLYYALLFYKIVITKEKLVEITDTKLYNLPEADKAIKRIFQNSSNYQFIFDKINYQLCDMSSFFDQRTNNVISQLLNFTPSQVDIAAVTYFVCSIPISKGGIFSSKIKTVNGEFVTFDFIKKHCGNMSKDTINKRIHEIKQFYKENKSSLTF